MVTREAEDVDIGFVRHQLDTLVADRSLGGWSVGDKLRYQELCAVERSLLCAPGA